MHFLDRRLIAPLALSALLALSPACGAAPVEVAGVSFDDPVTVSGTRLELNGAGVRHQAFFKVMAVALYLGRKASSHEAVLAAPGPKRLHISLLMDVPGKKFSTEFIRTFSSNAEKTQMSRLVPGLLRMSELLAVRQKYVRGDAFTVDWMPGKGMVIALNGAVQGEPIREKEFFETMLSNWVGPTPADWMLKDALLGQK